MRVLHNATDDNAGRRFTAELESALLARALAEAGGQTDERMRALLSSWLCGTFNASAAGLLSIGDGRGHTAWEPDGNGYRLTWYAPTGLACPLARMYPQENGTWAALIVAGVRDDPAAAMMAAEWGVARLAA